MRSFESRIRKLEELTDSGPGLHVILRAFSDRPLSGLLDVRSGQTYQRDPGELEEAFTWRVSALTATPADGCSMAILRELRS